MIKLIALDLDNTLLEKDNNIAPHTLDLLRDCAQKGTAVTIATGRIYYSAGKYARQIGQGTKILCYNGALMTEYDGKVLFSASLPVDTMRKVIAFCKEKGLYCQFYEDHKIVVEKVTEGTLIDPDLKNTDAIEVGDFGSYDLKPSHKGMIVAPEESVPGYQAMLAGILGDSAYLAQSQPYLIEIMPRGINKSRSLALLCDMLGITGDEVMACGDNSNDAEMLDWAGTGVAVANAVPSLKKIAEYVCEKERSEGVAEAVERFCL